jgi:hypothetical protein
MQHIGKCTLFGLCLSGLLFIQPLAANPQPEEDESCQRVDKRLQGGDSAKEVITGVVDGGMSLTEATVFAMVCGGQGNRVAMVTAGVALAGSLAEAQSVVSGVIAAAGEGSPEAVAVHEAFNAYKRTAKQPAVYEKEHIPQGGFVISPAT